MQPEGWVLVGQRLGLLDSSPLAVGARNLHAVIPGRQAPVEPREGQDPPVAVADLTAAHVAPSLAALAQRAALDLCRSRAKHLRRCPLRPAQSPQAAPERHDLPGPPSPSEKRSPRRWGALPPTYARQPREPGEATPKPGQEKRRKCRAVPYTAKTPCPRGLRGASGRGRGQPSIQRRTLVSRCG